jgi:hypothetical protein
VDKARLRRKVKANAMAIVVKTVVKTAVKTAVKTIVKTVAKNRQGRSPQSRKAPLTCVRPKRFELPTF